MSTYIARICRPSRESACLTTTGFGTRAASAHGDEVLDRELQGLLRLDGNVCGGSE
jgi:hypothetical protein